MKRFTIPALVIGLALVAFLVASSGAREVGAAVASVGWGALLVVLARVVTVVGAGIGWQLVVPAGLRPSTLIWVLIRLVREAVNTLLPFTQVGGDFVGARLLTFYRLEGPLAAASVVVDLMVQAGTQFLFTLAGLLLLIWLGGGESIAWVVAGGLALGAPALGAFYVAQRRLGHRLLQGLLTRLAGERRWQALGAVDALYGWLQALYQRRGALLGSAASHLVAWTVGTFEVSIALALMGRPVSFAEALVIESLAQALRGAAFMVPGAVGVQEGGLVALCAVFGVPAETALALSLVKRMADLAVGLPGLLAWYGLESRRWRGQGLWSEPADPLPGRDGGTVS